MDPKTLPTLDPKLKEAYERVMGTSLTPPAVQPTAPNTPTPSTGGPPPITSQSIQPPVAPIAQKVTVPVSLVPPVAPAYHATTTFVADNAVKPQAKISLPILLLGGIIFLLVYALFWMKFFNFKLPF